MEDQKQQTTYITREELKAKQAEKYRVDQARQQAHEACILLRRQLAQLEMDRRFRVEEIGINYKTGVQLSGTVPYVFSNKTEYTEFKNKMWWGKSTKTPL